MRYADEYGLFNVAQRMQQFAANPQDDATFWQPAPLLARLVAEGKTFTG
jgi:3-hydroxyacyl-CoA dehydrogenase